MYEKSMRKYLNFRLLIDLANLSFFSNQSRAQLDKWISLMIYLSQLSWLCHPIQIVSFSSLTQFPWLLLFLFSLEFENRELKDSVEDCSKTLVFNGSPRGGNSGKDSSFIKEMSIFLCWGNKLDDVLGMGCVGMAEFLLVWRDIDSEGTLSRHRLLDA